MTPWFSLFCRSDDQASVAALWRDQLTASGYAAFNPFGLLPGRTYRHAVRLFVAPPRSGWIRVLAETPPPLMPLPLLILACDLDGASPFTVFQNGAPIDLLTALEYYTDRACLERALNAPTLTLTESERAAVGDIPLDLLPADVRQMAAGIDPRQVGSLFERLSASMQGKLGGDAGAAGDLLKTAGADWNSASGQRIRALMACLRIDGWRDPDFVRVRDAYALHERRRRNPNATLYPGDAEAMSAVPDALAYIPVYAGRD
ncbi:MAG: hypothetical protein IAE80_13255 [Anaerolinea sp.]|nr:hypothetical protein [Anaerolinea sp.]